MLSGAVQGQRRYLGAIVCPPEFPEFPELPELPLLFAGSYLLHENNPRIVPKRRIVCFIKCGSFIV